MSNLKAERALVLSTILSLFIAIVLPSVAFADQGAWACTGKTLPDTR